MTDYQHLGIFSDLVQAAQAMHPLYPVAPPGAETQRRVREVLNFGGGDEHPADVRVERRWERDGLVGEELSWGVGYGPRTSAWVLKPVGATQPLPGVVALHDHGGFKFYGKEKIAEGPDGALPGTVQHQADAYGGRAFANALAREGFVVLVHDVFLWGSRRFPLESMPPSMRQTSVSPEPAEPDDVALATEIAHYNAAASLHEHLVEKYCALLGTTLAGVVSYEDRVAVNYLRARPDVRQVGCIGLSGGGCRAALLQATSDALGATAIVGMMSSYPGLLDHNVASHTWMFFPAGWARFGDWPDLAACRAPAPLLAQYDLDDDLFTREGMRAADARIAAHYRSVGHPEQYTGEFYPGPHKFDLPMQAAAFAWLKRQLAAEGPAETIT
jgi:dienelactone hydrolase